MKSFILKLIQKEKKRTQQINYIFCTDEYLLSINQQYLNHNTYTDIVTFELSEKNQPLIADIYISVERVRENAAAFDVAAVNELRRVMIHGALHLCGYTDKTKNDKLLMREKEDFYLSQYEVSRETNPRF